MNERPMAIILGFTGTKQGMTPEQKESVKNILTRFNEVKIKVSEAHHGDCVGADFEFHTIMKEATVPIGIHPPINPKYRAFCHGANFSYKDKLYPEKEYLDRNHDIVNVCDLLIATPKSFKEEIRSGTWATVRYAKHNNKVIAVIYPNGKVVYHG